MKIELKLDPDKLTLDDLIMVDELGTGQIPARQMKSFIARFVVVDGKYPPEEEAKQLAGKLTLAELRQAFEAMGGAVKELQAAAVPPEISAA